MNQQPETLEIANQIELAITCGFIGSAAQYQHLLLSAVSQLRHLHARVEELESVAADHIEQDLKMVAAPVVRPEPDAWAAVHFSGKRAGKIYTTCDTKEQIEAYIHQVHQSNDSITLRAEPIYMRSPAPQPQADARDAELLDWLEGEVCDSYTGVTITRVDHREDGMVIERGFRLRRFHKDYEVKPTLRAAIAASKENK